MTAAAPAVPRILFSDAPSMPLQMGDVLCLAANPPVPHPCPREHLALLAENIAVPQDDDLRGALVLGLPESGVDGPGLRAVRRPGIVDLPDVRSGALGHTTRGWNLGIRVFEGPEEGQHLVPKLQKDRELMRTFFRFDERARIAPFRGPVSPNNCVGFVASALKLKDGPSMVVDSYRFEYEDPYHPGDTRDYPSPGHFTWAAESRPIPFVPTGPEQAERFATAGATIEYRKTGGIKREGGRPDGEASITGTGVPIWRVASMRRDGLGDAEILGQHPQMVPRDLDVAARFADTNPGEIVRAIGAPPPRP